MVGHPKPTVKWYRSGKEILADGTKIKAQEFKGGYYQLVITTADENDAAVYQVRATNSSGSISTTANLEVEGNDIIFVLQKKCHLCYLKNANLCRCYHLIRNQNKYQTCISSF